MARCDVAYARASEPFGCREEALPATAPVVVFQKAIDALPHELRHRDTPLGRHPSQLLVLFRRERDLRPDHAVMISLLV